MHKNISVHSNLKNYMYLVSAGETDFSWETVYDYVAVGRLRRLKSSVCSSATPAMPSSYH